MIFVALTVSGLLLYSTKVLTLSPGTPNGCRHPNGTRFCCSGFYELNGECQECIDSRGYNCASPCPFGFFGPGCRKSCTCQDEECHQVLGCPEEKPPLKGLLLLHLKADTDVKDNITSSPENDTISHHTNMSNDLIIEDVSGDIGIWEYLMHFIKTWMQWFIVSITVLCLSFAGICIIKCRKKGRKKETQQNCREHDVFEVHQDNHENVYTDMFDENMSPYTDINTTEDETSEKEYMHRSNFFEEQTEGHDYCGLNVYTEMSDIQTNAYTDVKAASPENIKGCGYMHLNDLFEEQTDSHEYHDMNEHVSTDLSHEKDSRPSEYGSTEHVYMYI